MSETRWTPGPWQSQTWHERYPEEPDQKMDGVLIYTLIWGGCGYNTSDGNEGLDVANWLLPANARLITAAPDMIDALISVVAHLEAFEAHARKFIEHLPRQADITSALAVAKAAIAKATGGGND